MDNNAHQGLALSQANQMGSVLMAAGQALSKKDRTIAERERAITERDKKIAELKRMLVAQQGTVDEQRLAIVEGERTIAQRDAIIAEHRHSSAEHQRTIAERNVVIAELKRTITERDNTIARISEHSRWLEYHSRQVTTMATAAVTAHNTITLGNGAPPCNVGPDEDAPSRDDAAPRASAPRDDTLPRDDDAAMGDNDNTPDNTASGADNAPGNDAVPGDDVARTDTAPSVTPPRTSAPANEIAESAQVSKRRRVNQQVRDGSEQIITSEGLFEVVGPTAFTDIDVLADIYEVVTDRPLIPDNVEPQEFTRRLAGLKGFAPWAPRFTEAGSTELASLNLLRRSDSELKALRPIVLRQLGLEGQPGAVVLGPRLCYVLVSLGGLRLDNMTGPVLEKVFRTITQKSLRSLTVVTKDGVGPMMEIDIGILVNAWVRKLSIYITRSGGVQRSLRLAARCNDYYKTECNERGGSSNGLVAESMLKEDGYDSNLFLGNDDADDLEDLYTGFFAIVDGSVDQHIAERLRQIANSLQNRSE
ncbi:hypothetical protein GGI17_005666 [Coemansia sp. S146]|nr:hypothetical protein GGI17_005666 [Coemansia sp. S146]